MRIAPVKKRIPTIVGIIILIIGIGSGVLLTNARQIFKIGASIDTTPKNVRVSNISEDGFTISFTTDQNTPSFIKVSSDKFFLGQVNVKRSVGRQATHYYEFDGMLPEKEYFASINVSGTDYYTDKPLALKTGVALPEERGAKVIYGKVYSKSGEEQGRAIVYAQCGNGSMISTVTSENGAWSLTVSKTRTADLLSYEPIDDKKTIISLFIMYGQTTSSITTHVENAKPLPAVILGANLDLRNSVVTKAYELPPTNIFGTSSASLQIPLFVKNVYKERNSFSK